MKLFSRLLMWRKRQLRDFNTFFNEASPQEREKLFRDVMRKASEDQRKIIEQYEKLHPKAT